MSAPYQANAVLVGRKDTMNYVLAAIRLFTEGASEVIIKARGKNICKAVDAAERVRSTLKDVEIRDVKIYSEEIEGEEGRKRRVSAIEIVLTRRE
ncbi:MAG: DNA-binding protein Alba [Desulfurococcales archaeon]|nr:DNA-binding protein Alba [Desulfurococcales archaeon]